MKNFLEKTKIAISEIKIFRLLASIVIVFLFILLLLFPVTFLLSMVAIALAILLLIILNSWFLWVRGIIE